MVAAKRVRLAAEHVQPEAAGVERVEDLVDLLGACASADGADADAGDLGQVDTCLAVHVEVTEVVLDRLSLEHR